jgi:hypothetical protein
MKNMKIQEINKKFIRKLTEKSRRFEEQQAKSSWWIKYSHIA